MSLRRSPARQTAPGTAREPKFGAPVRLRPKERSARPGFIAFVRLHHQHGLSDTWGVLSIRAARRYRWRLAGGRLIVDDISLRFAPNLLECRRADTYWECVATEVTGVRVRGKVWLVVETARGAETFRVFGASAAAPRLQEALILAAVVPG